MRIATWNVNSLKVRLPHVLKWLADNPVDVLCLQETKQQDEETERVEGEKRFHTNCSRCHQYPHKFPPRMMATIVRHMRVRATITDEDMRLVLRYMTQ